MENATKALLMAGGVLIAIIIITLLVRTYGNIGRFQKQQLSAEEARQIEEYNKNYTKYDGQYVYGTEVITVINRATNEKQRSGQEGKIYITFKEGGYTYKIVDYDKNTGRRTQKEITIKPNSTLVLSTEEEQVGKFMGVKDKTASFIDEINNENALEDLKGRAFKCTKIGYDTQTGKVNEIRFEEKQYNDLIKDT